jgi:hypothetical protein
MKVGGPQSYDNGFRTQELNDVFLELGKPFNLDIFLQDESQQLSEVVLVLKQSFWKCRNDHR